MEDTFPEGRRGGDKGPLAARGSAGELLSSIQQPHVYSTPPYNPTRRAHLVKIGKMAEPIVQTIHRDPALLYVNCAFRCSTVLTRR
jgi:hypothetical protein